MNHKQYIASDEWKKLRQEALSVYGHGCSVCGSFFNIQLHHVYYAPNLKCTRVEHLMPLCGECHGAIHKSKTVRSITYNEAHLETKKREIIGHLKSVKVTAADAIEEKRQQADLARIAAWKARREQTKKEIALRAREQRRQKKINRRLRKLEGLPKNEATPACMIRQAWDAKQHKRWTVFR